MEITINNTPDDTWDHIVRTDSTIPEIVKIIEHCSNGDKRIWFIRREQLLVLPDHGDPHSRFPSQEPVPVTCVLETGSRCGHIWLTPTQVRKLKEIVT